MGTQQIGRAVAVRRFEERDYLDLARRSGVTITTLAAERVRDRFGFVRQPAWVTVVKAYGEDVDGAHR